jgi:hypothetical protein
VDSVAATTVESPMQASRLRTLQALGVFCGSAADAWLGGAEAPVLGCRECENPAAGSNHGTRSEDAYALSFDR